MSDNRMQPYRNSQPLPVYKILSWVLAVWTYSLQPYAYADSLPTLRFCYEDKQVLPYFTGDNSEVPSQPGATIEHLRQATLQSGITLQLIRMPWLRCLQQLENNQVDALVAAYVPERAHYTVYPKRPDGAPDSNKAINRMGLCLAHRYDNPLQQKLTNKSAIITVSRPLGYRPITFPANTVLIGAHSLQQALELVVNGRVDATTVLCQLNGVDAKERHLSMLPVQLLYPPLHQSVGYLMLSRQFYQRYPQQSEQLWQALAPTLNKDNYLQYLNFQSQ